MSLVSCSSFQLAIQVSVSLLSSQGNGKNPVTGPCENTHIHTEKNQDMKRCVLASHFTPYVLWRWIAFWLIHQTITPALIWANWLMHSTAGCSLSILLVRHRMGLSEETGSSFVHSKAEYVSQLMECVWGWTDNECEGKRRECRKSAACGTPTCSIEIMTYSHIPGSWWLSAPPDIWSCRETVWHRPSCQSTVFNFSFLALSSPRPLPLKLHLAQN